MRILRRFLLALLVSMLGIGAVQAHDLQRSKTGPATVRGVTAHLTSRGFDLLSPSKGTIHVLLSPATSLIEKGISGRVTLHDGDHVGVRGFVRGRSMTAISVRVYPVKAKALEVRGTVSSVQGTALVVRAGSRTYHIVLNSLTTIRIGNALGSASQIRVGDRVQVRVQPGSRGLAAIHVRVYRTKAIGRHVQLRGTVQTASSATLRVNSGKASTLIRVVASTKIYLGSTSTSASALKAGQTVRVYACCAGGSLTATSIHIERSSAHVSTSLLHGRVTALSPTRISVATANGHATVVLTATTTYQVGSQTVGRTGIRIGDQISIRVYRQGASVLARSVHVLASSRRPRTVTGIVQSVGPHGIVVLARGKRYVVSATATATVTLNGAHSALSRAQKGDHVRAVGQLQGTALVAGQIALRHGASRNKPTILHGVISRVSGPVVVVTDSSGALHQVKLKAGVVPLLHGKAANLALFPGVRVVAHGYVTGNVLMASSFTVTVRERSIKGRIDRVSRWYLMAHLHSGQILTLDLVQGSMVSDAGHRLSAANLHPGAYIDAQGYEEQANRLRTITLLVDHPTLALAGNVLAAGAKPTIQTSQGERYTLKFSTASQIRAGNANISLTPGDIPTGIRVNAQGTMQSDGTLLVARLDVHLSVETLRGTVTTASASQLTVNAGSSTVQVRLDNQTAVTQGSHSLVASDIVVGDDITVHGYRLGGWLAASKILVHRKLTSLDGTVGDLTADGFMLVAADGSHRVIVSSAAIFTGGASNSFVPGTTLHITGYRRGDGVILATRIKPGKKIKGS